jgi:pyruvate dehydrogenase E2 component (dihydrolipoamide acetyltransferase)
MTTFDDGDSRRIPLSRMRKVIARTMSASAHVPQFTIEVDVNLAALLAARAQAKSAGTDVSVVDFFVAACAETLREHPRVNASFDDDAITEHAQVNVGLAVALDDGLIAPAVRAADHLTISELAAERIRLTAAAAAGTLTAEEAMSATFTLSNLGPYGIHRFRALVVPPQAAILAIGAPTGDNLVSFSLSCDHRVLDGVPAALFLRAVADRLQAPNWLDRTVALAQPGGGAPP